MNPPPRAPRPIVLLGPTAGGKSGLALAIAQQRGGEIIGADSMQVYRHLDAGTAKPTHDMRQMIRHHGVDVVEPTQRFTVHDWLKLATDAIDLCTAKNKTPIIVGGTNLYLKALLEGMFDGPGQDPRFRASLEAVETPTLHDRLKEIDPQTADRLKPADRQRIVRALEVYELTGKPISAMQTQWDRAGAGSGVSGFRLLGLRWSAEKINPRINLRVKAMFYPHKVEPKLASEVCINGESLIEEVQRLKEQGKFDPIIESPHADAAQSPTPTLSESASEASGTSPNQAREALGYKQLLAVLEKNDPKINSTEDAYERTKILTRRFAKQQRTWLKRFSDVHWIDCDDADTPRITSQALDWAISAQ